MRLVVNGAPLAISADSSIADVVALLTGSSDGKGIAVAVDRCVIPRSQWSATPARADTHIEVVSAAAGG